MASRHPIEHVGRSAMKALTYRAMVVVLDLLAVYLLTGSTRDAIGFAIASNIYTTVAYYLHERLWAHSHWGTRPPPHPVERAAQGVRA